MTEPIVVSFDYLNHRGIVKKRTIDVECLEFIREVGFNYQPGWFLSGRCHEKDARRSFALSRIVFDDDDKTRHLLCRIALTTTTRTQ